MSRIYSTLAASFALGSALWLGGCGAKADEPGLLPSDIRQNVDALIEQGLQDKVGLRFVEDLTTNIGPRLAGSPAEARARDWAVAELKALGFDNVHVEDFTIPYWSRITERASVVGENPQPLTITALGGSPSTPAGGVEAQIVRFTSLKELMAAPEAGLTGKIAFIDEGMTRTQDGSGYGMAVRKRGGCAAAAAAKGAAACLIRSVGTQSHRMPHTGGMSREGPLGALPAAALSPPDADQLTRLLARGPVTVNLNLSVKSATSAPSGNVIAEVAGTSRADEIVLIGCHLDSWDLGTGALDDGAGCGIVVGAAKLIDALPGKPERTIRVILYGSEEVGLFGGHAYAEQHADELDKHVLAAESDFGAGNIWRFQTRFGEGATAYRDAMLEVLGPLGISPGDNMAGGGPDVSMLPALGVPVVTPGQDGSDYFDYHHTPDDTFDKINPETFRQNVATYAAFAYLAADTGWDFRKAADEGRMNLQPYLQKAGASLSFATLEARRLPKDMGAWQWLSIALVMALQASLVIALSGYETADPADVLDPSDLEGTKLAPISLMLRRVRSADYLSPPERLNLPVSASKGAEKLLAFRNAVIHGPACQAPPNIEKYVRHTLSIIDHLLIAHPAFNPSPHAIEMTPIRDGLRDIRLHFDAPS